MITVKTFYNSISEDFTPNSGETLELCLINLPSGGESANKTTTTSKINVHLNNPNSAVQIYQIGVANDKQSIDTEITVNHNAIDCKSEVISHYVLSDENAITNWVGNVVINQGAKGTQTFEENRNLLLKKGAKAKSEPNLEIFEGDILEAKHASASSRFDDEELFYIMSRGIDKEHASKLILHAFLDSVIDKMSISDDEKTELLRKVEEL